MEKISFHEMGGGILTIRSVLSLIFYHKLDVTSMVLVIFSYQTLVEPTKIERWAVVNFSARCDIRSLVSQLIKCGGMKGIVSSVLTSFLHYVNKWELIRFSCVFVEHRSSI